MCDPMAADRATIAFPQFSGVALTLSWPGSLHATRPVRDSPTVPYCTYVARKGGLSAPLGL